jgi:glycosyltransferase involved in cell wall biosynthesis
MTQENQGASVARNKAFELCQEDYIQWLDADDLLASDSELRGVKGFRNPHVELTMARSTPVKYYREIACGSLWPERRHSICAS